MSDRRSLVDAMKSPTPAVDKAKEREFVYGDKAPPPQSQPKSVNRVPISTRIREDFAKAIKRASLERQLHGIEPNTQIDILEEALEPWLKSNGYLP